MDLLKCILVILLPDAKDFGCLIILSYISISTGWLLYATFSRQQRGHLFHFCWLIPCCNQNDRASNSHWPFLAEPKSEHPVHDFEEEYSLSSNELKENNTPIIISSGDVERTDNIIS